MAYNEEASIVSVLDEVAEALERLGRPAEVIVVDDGSQDTTGEVAARWAADRPLARIVRHEANRGLGGVYRTGLREARGEFVTFFPADGQFPADNLAPLRAAAESCDLVLGYLSESARPPLARLLSGAEKLVYRLAVGSLPRFQGVFMVRRSILGSFPLLSRGRGWGVALELVLRAVRTGHRHTSVLTRARPRRFGRSKVRNAATIFANLNQVLALRALLKQQGEPLSSRPVSRFLPAELKAPLALSLLGALALAGYALATRHGPALEDEFIYLAGARYLATTGSLDARFYHADAILAAGHPHQDDHAPGYALLLGGLIALVGGSYGTAVALNAVAYLASALLVRGLALRLGVSGRAALVGGALYLVLPVYLPYVFWVMAEVVLGALFLAALFVAVSAGDDTRKVVLAALLFGAGVLVRESVLLALPVFLVALSGRRRTTVFLAVVLAFLALVFWPLSRNRAPGGANFWEPTSGDAFAFRAVQVAQEGRWSRAAELGLRRARQNFEEVTADYTSGTERAILGLFVLLPAWAWLGWRRRGRRQRQLIAALTLSWLAMAGLMVLVYVVGRWSGIRYLMFLMPAFLPWVGPGPDRGRVAPLLTGALGVALVFQTFGIFDGFKASRLRRQAYYADFVEQRVDVRQLSRVVFPRGFLFGLRHPRLEVILDLPTGGGGALRTLERAIDFELLVLPRGHALEQELDERLKYRRLNRAPGDDLVLYRRLR